MNAYFRIRYRLGYLKKKLTEFWEGLQWDCSLNEDIRDSKEQLDAIGKGNSKKRCFVLGNGPSLNKMDLNLMKNDVVIVSNSFYLKFNDLGFTPNFLTVEDHLVAEDNHLEFSKLKGITKVFPYDLRKVLKKDKNTIYVNLKRAKVHHTSPYFPPFSSDCVNKMYWGGTVSYMSIQLAAHLGFKEIYLIGVDLSYQIPKDIIQKGSVLTSQSDDPNHFDSNYFGAGKRWHLPEVERMQVSFDKANLSLGNQGIKLYNATVGGNLNNIERVVYEDLF